MLNLEPLEPGVMFWAGRDDLNVMRGLGVRCGQLGIGGDYIMNAESAADWTAALKSPAFSLVTLVAAYNGEDYADIPTVQRTVGFIPRATREERVLRTIELSDFAAALGVKSIACHIGFVPEDSGDADYISVREEVRRICDHAATHGQTFALETGQESAVSLLHFLKDVGRPNLGINFDPANMILYGTGEPIAALELLRPHVLSVHAKDGLWPAPEIPGALGTEVPLGQGAVGMPRFVETLRRTGFNGPLNVERETDNQVARVADMGMGVSLLRSLAAAA
jgi:sugar phosphate isomerase/epimerase